ncbi:glycosyltransferase [Chaetomidium leptoderma]|uniref:Glycosyltransferase n=1 Tax=Chaetomidium leptoderma TaxID=669021 RepID=A0AAN6ZUQ7_9PEZI|nr:glycosyltransferase [Chaetomidium leptoderma]
MAFPRRPSAILRYTIPALLLALTFYILTKQTDLSSQISLLLRSTPWPTHGSAEHPIDRLIKTAEKEFAIKIAKSTETLPAAAAAYRQRRGRHPPPGFDKWHDFAREKNAIIVEDFWDQIYHDLEPFWALKPARIRKDAREFEMRIEIRDRKASTRSDWFWTQIWLEMIQTIEHLLPDMDLALNAMDEPRLVVPWEEIEGYMKKAAKTRKLVDAKRVVSEFRKLPPPGEEPPEQGEMEERRWEHDKHYWLIARRGCAPSSAARQSEVITNFNQTPFIASSFDLVHMQAGYVANYTLSSSFCHQADLQALEGIFVEPLSVSASKHLLPVFGGSKLAVNNDILLPAPMYWNAEERFTGAGGASIPWAAKSPTAIWRGVATGGLNRASNWRSFQRHRFVAMNNASQLADPRRPLNFALPAKQYPLPPSSSPSTTTTAITTTLAEWISTAADIAFTDLMCAHETGGPGFWPGGCDYTSAYFAPSPPLPMAEQFRHRVLPDIDGNSFSGRYLGFLRSTSLPVKATLWREWHDARLVAWKHFVPMDNRFGDWYGILAYFVGGGGGGGRDGVGERIAMEGKEWAGRVLRREDMQVYVLRLLLEYARVVDERREVMGWVGDLS